MAAKEHRLQHECTYWYRNQSGLPQPNFWATFNEGQNANMKLSLGLWPGVSDTCLKDQRGLGGIELKYPGESHEVARVIRQATWIIKTCDFGGFCDNLEDFKKICLGGSNWIDPARVIEVLKKMKVSSFTWDSKLFK